MKIAVIFPGIGYHADKPLLYYSRKIAVSHGYEIKNVPYGNFPAGVKGNREKMKDCFSSALEQTEEMLRDVDFSKYDEILFISKSIGTAVAAAYGREHGLKTKNIYFTPVEDSFQFMDCQGIVFHGTADSWADTRFVKEECEKRGFPLHIVEDANHSLETGDWENDVKALHSVMLAVEGYLNGKNEA
ncbi:MAG: alpha/beta hydrolase [Lachnospiraceae bacterium]|nr:alpha/beta hydrolase [Lachnospiraceae bacterium]